MIIEAWLRIYCPTCSTSNWLSAGECEDAPDELEFAASGFRCRKCHRNYSLDGEIYDEEGDLFDPGRSKP